MEDFPQIRHVLRTVFNGEDGLSEDVSIRLHQRMVLYSANQDELKDELRSAFANPDLSWRRMLSNEAYEVFDADSEEEARSYAVKILWNPVFGE